MFKRFAVLRAVGRVPDNIACLEWVKKLKHMGLKDSVLSLLTNYLANRQQTTIVYGISSDLSSMTCGVPQGSTLGPLLFILYINDLPNYIKDVNVKLYADDTVFDIDAANIKSANTSMNLAAANFNDWCWYNKLTINASKSKCMLFSGEPIRVHNELKTHINILIHIVTLETVSEYKYLGIILDERLSLVKHINYIVSTISNRLFTLKKIRQYINTDTALLLYKTVILSYYDIGESREIIGD